MKVTDLLNLRIIEKFSDYPFPPPPLERAIAI